MDLPELFRGDGEVVIAGHQEAFVLQALVGGQNRIEAFPILVDEIAERHHEGQILAIQDAERLLKLDDAVAIIAIQQSPGLGIGILRVGENAEAEEGFF